MRATGLARIIQEDHYYAFGGKLAGRSYDFANGNRYTYTGQEHMELMDLYDHGAPSGASLRGSA